jgi:hypothetical protein
MIAPHVVGQPAFIDHPASAHCRRAPRVLHPRGSQTEPHWNLDDAIEDENPHKNAGFHRWAILGSNQ